MIVLSIDIETYSDVDLLKSGVYAYTDSDQFEILMFAYAYDDGPVQIIDLKQGEVLPDKVLSDLTKPSVIKSAFNANFERTCISKYLASTMPIEISQIYMDPNQWHCTAVHALYAGLPGNLDGVAKALKLDDQKDSTGKALIRYFSLPCKATKVNGGRTRNLPVHDPKKWQQFLDYCKQDVEVERSIRKRLERIPVPETEWKLWALDQEIVDRGVLLNPQMVEHAVACDSKYQEKRKLRAMELTGLDNPNSVAQLKGWLKETDGIEVDSLAKDILPDLIKQTKNETVKEVLELRQEMSKTSVKKYQAMERVICRDNRVRGLLQFYGASRTGRWAGRLVQVQNLPSNKMKQLDLARNLLLEGNYEALELLFDQVPDVLSQLVRTAFVAPEGSRFIVSDFSAIEARVIAWLAGEQWRLDVFATHGKIYEASASQMFGVPVEEIGKGSPLRQKGKIAELALGYGGGVGALDAMGALNMGLEEKELAGLVKAWRAANPYITKLWWECGDAALETVQNKTRVELHHGIAFHYQPGMLFIELPSGRRLSYVAPAMREGKFGQELSYMGVGATKKWERIGTYGPKIVENIVQAIARDCLAQALIRLNEAGATPVMHVHDEVVLEEPYGSNLDLAEVEHIMGLPIKWAPGLDLPADGYETEYYLKD